MATDFWASTHYKRWIVERATVQRARSIDLQYVTDPDYLALMGMFFSHLISRLGQEIGLRQRAIATANVFFRRFYLKNSYCETDPCIVLTACCYLASKAEEFPIHIKPVIAAARTIFGEYGIKNFPSDSTKLAEMEFYLVDDLECDLIVFHPYRTLMAVVRDSSGTSTGPADAEAGELGVGIEDGPRYWGTGEGKLTLHQTALQTAWFIINDTYRSDICIMYPPHLIAFAALCMVCIIDPGMRKGRLDWEEFQQQAANSQLQNAPATRRSSRHGTVSSGSGSNSNTQSSSSGHSGTNGEMPQDLVGFWANLNISMPIVASIVQDMIAFYALCNRLKEDSNTAPQLDMVDAPRSARARLKRPHVDTSEAHISSYSTGVTDSDPESAVTAASLLQLLVEMRARRESDMTHPASGRPVAVHKVLERAQAAG